MALLDHAVFLVSSTSKRFLLLKKHLLRHRCCKNQRETRHIMSSLFDEYCVGAGAMELSSTELATYDSDSSGKRRVRSSQVHRSCFRKSWHWFLLARKRDKTLDYVSGSDKKKQYDARLTNESAVVLVRRGLAFFKRHDAIRKIDLVAY